MAGQTYEDQIKALIVQHNQEAILLDGCDEALVGMVHLWGGQSVAVYDATTVVELLVKKKKMTPAKALEFFEQKIDQQYMGPGTPLFIIRPPEPSKELQGWE